MTAQTQIACKCGAVKGYVAEISQKSSSRLNCYCKYCMGSALHLDASRMDLVARGYVDLLQIDPDKITIIQGAKYLAALKFSDKGPVRWYAQCCNTPFCNTLDKRFPPFASLNAELFDTDAELGPVKLHSFCDHLPAKARPAHSGKLAMTRFVAGFGKRALRSRLSGRFKENPFFDEDGQMIVQPRTLSKDERTAAFAAAGIAKP